MNIKNILIENGYETETEQISEKILAFDVEDCTNVRRMPTFISDLFDGFELSNDDGVVSFTINLEDDSEFLPFARFEDTEDGVVETGFNDNCEVVYKFVDGEEVYWKGEE